MKHLLLAMSRVPAATGQLWHVHNAHTHHTPVSAVK